MVWDVLRQQKSTANAAEMKLAQSAGEEPQFAD
jgi:hypothetical protein